MWHDEAIGYMKSCMSYLGIFDIKDIQEEIRKNNEKCNNNITKYIILQ